MAEIAGELAEFYAHAIAFEREAAKHYRTYESYFASCGETVLARLCRNLAVAEEGHFEELRERAKALALPAVPPDRFRWPTSGPVDVEGTTTVHPGVTPRELLENALAAERRAQAYFESVASASRDGPIGQLAAEMGREEAEHAQWVTFALKHLGKNGVDWGKMLAEFGEP